MPGTIRVSNKIRAGHTVPPAGCPLPSILGPVGLFSSGGNRPPEHFLNGVKE